MKATSSLSEAFNKRHKMKISRKIISLAIVLLLIFSVSPAAFAQEILSFSANGKIMSVAHDGDTMLYPKNTLAAVSAAFEEGADAVSVSVRKTADGHFVLSQSDDLGETSLEGKGMLISLLPLSQIVTLHVTDRYSRLSEHLVTELEAVLKTAVAYDKTVIIDGEWQSREDIYQVICECDANENAIIRTDASAKEIADFISVTDSACQVIGQYHGNILFGARSYITNLSSAGCKIIYLGTKNWFGEIFRSPVLSAFSRSGYAARAAIKAFDMNESGQRADCEESWGDLIDRGYSVIETDRIADLIAYTEKIDSERVALRELLENARGTETAFLTAESKSAIKDASDKAEFSIMTISSFETLSLAKSRLNFALNNKVLSDSPENKNEGVLNITGGKITAVIIAAVAVIAVQIYFYFRQADKKMPRWMKRLLQK